MNEEAALSAVPGPIAAAMTDGYLVVDSSGLVESANRAAGRLLGCSSPTGRRLAELLAESGELERALGEQRGELVVLQPASDSFMHDPLDITVVPRSDGSGRTDLLLQGAAFKTSRERRLFYQATHDYLTGLYNRRMFEDHLSREIADACPGERLSLVIIDVEGISGYASSEGRAAGEALVLAVASALETAASGAKALARLGDHEFALVLRDTAAPMAILRTERLLDAVASVQPPTFVLGKEVAAGTMTAPGRATGARLRVVAGIAVYPDAAEHPLALLRAADAARGRAERNRCGYAVAPALERRINEQVDWAPSRS